MLISWTPDPNSTDDAYNVYVSQIPFNSQNLPEPTQVAATETSLDIPETSAYVRVGAVQGGFLKLSALYKTSDLPDSILLGSITKTQPIENGMEPTGTAYSPDGALLAVVADNSSTGPDARWLTVFDAETSAVLLDANTTPPTPDLPGEALCCTFSPDSSLLAIGTKAGPVFLRTSDWTIVAGTPTLNNVNCYAIEFSPANDEVAFSASSTTITAEPFYIYSATDWTDKGVVFDVSTQNTYVLKYSVDGQLLALKPSSFSSDVSIFNTADWSLNTTISLAGQVGAVAFSPDNQKMAVAHEPGNISIFNISDWSLDLEITGAPEPRDIGDSLAYSPCGLFLMMGAYESPYIQIVNASTGEVTSNSPTFFDPVYGVGFKPDGTRFAVAEHDNSGFWVFEPV